MRTARASGVSEAVGRTSKDDLRPTANSLVSALLVAVGDYDHHERLPRAVAAADELADRLEKASYS